MKDLPEVAVIDLDLGRGPNGIDVAVALRDRDPSIGLVLLTSYEDPRLVDDQLPALPRGTRYLRKRDINNVNEVASAIHDAAHGPLTMQRHEPLSLTESQLHILRGVAEGLSTAEIARRRGVSDKAIEANITRLCEHFDLPRVRLTQPASPVGRHLLPTNRTAAPVKLPILGPRTLAWPAMLILTPIGLGAALVSDERSSFEGRLTWLGLGLAAQAMLIIVVRIGVALGAQRRSLTIALVVVLAAGARATVIAIISEPLGLSDPLAPAARIVAATGTFTLWMIVIGAGAQASFNYRQSLASMLNRVNNARADASAFTKVWNDRIARMGNSASELLRVATKLHDDIQKRLRPVSHRLWFGLSNRQAQHRFVTAMLHEPLPIAAIAGSSLVLYVWIIAQGFGAWFALLSGVSINICFTGTLIAGRFLHQRRPGLTVQLATIFAATLATGAAASVFFSSLRPDRDHGSIHRQPHHHRQPAGCCSVTAQQQSNPGRSR